MPVALWHIPGRERSHLSPWLQQVPQGEGAAALQAAGEAKKTKPFLGVTLTSALHSASISSMPGGFPLP